MGLDVLALRRARQIPKGYYDDDMIVVGQWGLESPQSEGLTIGAFTGSGGTFRFRSGFSKSGSYAWHSRWLDWLAGLYGMTAKQVCNGAEIDKCGDLIRAECGEVLFGPSACARLSRELYGLRIAAMNSLVGDSRLDAYMATYDNFRMAFQLGADDGIVSFRQTFIHDNRVR